MLNEKMNSLIDKLISDIQKNLKIKSSITDEKPNIPFGEGINDALLAALSIRGARGFKTKNLEGFAGYIEWGQGEEIVVVLGHLDVVLEGDGWTYPPYGAEIHGGREYMQETP